MKKEPELHINNKAVSVHLEKARKLYGEAEDALRNGAGNEKEGSGAGGGNANAAFAMNLFEAVAASWTATVQAMTSFRNHVTKEETDSRLFAQGLIANTSDALAAARQSLDYFWAFTNVFCGVLGIEEPIFGKLVTREEREAFIKNEIASRGMEAVFSYVSTTWTSWLSTENAVNRFYEEYGRAKNKADSRTNVAPALMDATGALVEFFNTLVKAYDMFEAGPFMIAANRKNVN